MDYSTRLPSLQHRTMVQIAHSLWKKSSAASTEFPLTMENFMGTVETDIHRISKLLPLPNLLRMMLTNIYKNMNVDLFSWIKYHSHIFSHTIDTIIPNVILYWTSDGYIDRKETARTLIRNINIDISERYKMACAYCFEEDIRMLYKELLERDGSMLMYWDLHDFSCDTVRYWNHKMQKDECTDHFFCTNTIIFAAEKGNKFATEYFFHKLSPENRNWLLVTIAKFVVIKRRMFDYDSHMFKEQYSDVLCFLINQMSENQFKEILNFNRYHVLHSFVDWPWQVCLTNVMTHFRGCISEEDYLRVLQRIVFKFENSFKDFEYRKLFKEFWHEIPVVSKKYILKYLGDSILELFGKMKFAFQPETFELKNVIENRN